MVIIRKAKLKDIPRLAEINTFGEILKRCSPLDKLDPKLKDKDVGKYYKNFIYGKNKFAYVAEDKSKIIGFILFNIKKRESFWKIKEVGYIDLVFIKKEYRKKGISKLLMNKAKEIFKKRKLKYIALTAQVDNIPAVKVWHKQGFKDFKIDMYKKL